MSNIPEIEILDIERPLPVGMEEFNQFATRIIDLAGKYADEDSMRWALANMIMHADTAKGTFSDRYFINRLRKAAANQVAAQVINDIKDKQQAAALKQQAEATANTLEVASNDSKKETVSN